MVNSTEEQTHENSAIVYERWEQYGLKDELLRAIYGAGFDSPSFIQKTAVMPIITGRDIRAQAQSGTGKTAAFAVGALQRLTDAKETQVLVLVSTREIAEQNAVRIGSLAQFMDVHVTVLSGGTDLARTTAELKNKPEIVVGTPGRVNHMIQEGHLATDKITLLIIDEADEMLNRGFKEQVKAIFAYLPEDMQVAMFSATWEKEEMDVASEILRDPVHIDLRHDEQTLKGIDQFYVNLGDRLPRGSDQAKSDSLLDIFRTGEFGLCVIFVSTRNKAKFVHSKFTEYKVPVELMHSELTHRERTEVLDRFRAGECRMLIATGLIGRGIDIQALSLVINFDIPKAEDKSTYIHRIGRAGRYGRKGIAINFVFNDEMDTLREIERHYRTKIAPLPGNYKLK